jgi:hypothetical protein
MTDSRTDPSRSVRYTSTVPVELWCTTDQGDAPPLRTHATARSDAGAHTQHGPDLPATESTMYWPAGPSPTATSVESANKMVSLQRRGGGTEAM